MHLHRELHPGLGGQRDLPIDPGRLAASIALCHFRTLISVLLYLRSINFCRFLTVARFPSCAAVKIRCRSRRTLSSWLQPVDGFPGGEGRVLGAFHPSGYLSFSFGSGAEAWIDPPTNVGVDRVVTGQMPSDLG